MTIIIIDDDRLRALMARLEEMTPPAPEFELLDRTQPVSVQPTRTVSILAMAAAAVLIVVGLAFIAGRGSDRAPIADQLVSKHSVARILPPGWDVKGAADATLGAIPIKLYQSTIYTTAAAPAGPILATLASGAFFDDPRQMTTQARTKDGRRATLATGIGGSRSLQVEITPGHWSGVVSRNVSDADLLVIGAQLQSGPDPIPAAIVGPLPDGLVAAGSADLFGGSAMSTYPSNPDNLGAGAAMTGYGPVGGTAEATLVAESPTALQSSVLGLLGSVTPLADVGAGSSTDRPITYAVDFGENAGIGVYRVSGGVAFLVRSSTLTTAQISTMLGSITPADDVEWAALVAERARQHPSVVGDSRTVDSTMPAPPSYAATDTKPVAVALDYDISVVGSGDARGVLATATAPVGALTMGVRFVGRTMNVDARLDGISLATASVDVNAPGSGQIGGDRDKAYLYVYTAPVDGPVDEMRITADGYVYSTKFVVLDPTYPVRVAMILLPPHARGSNAPKGHLYDGAGQPLDSVG